MQEIVRDEAPVKQNGFLSRAMSAGAKIGKDAACMKQTVSRAVDDGMMEAKRLVKKGRYRAADMINETTYLIKREPMRAVAITFGFGLGVGMLAGWLFKRNGKA
jgi:ElaB/YqjD/DUF883 family membrane-anchored ribosome-binding protein